MVYEASINDVIVVAEMARIMWHGHTLEELVEEFENIVGSDEAVVYIVAEEGQPIGFAQCQLRHDYVEGTDSSPVGYLEGIFIKDEYRGKGYAKELISYCEKWSLKKGCREFASDCEISNSVSLKFHMNMGFHEANRIICFVKKL